MRSLEVWRDLLAVVLLSVQWTEVCAWRGSVYRFGPVGHVRRWTSSTGLYASIAPSIPPSSAPSPVIFAGVKIPPPMSASLRSLRIENSPTQIQKAALPLICSGQSCILHAATGTGKTLAYLLPALKMLYTTAATSSAALSNALPLQVLIIVPTRELAAQVKGDIELLTGGDAAIAQVLTQRSIPTAPICIATPYRLLDIIKDRDSAAPLRHLQYLVLDEVDRLIPVASRYLYFDESKKDEEEVPVIRFLEALTALKVSLRKWRSKAQQEADDPTVVQVVAASATVGRPLRREMSKVLGPLIDEDEHIDVKGEYGGQFVVVRGDEGDLESHGRKSDARGSKSGREDPGESESTSSRKVGIPSGIVHHIEVDMEETDSVAGKLQRVQAKYLATGGFKRSLLFVPKADEVDKVLGVLSFWGYKHISAVTPDPLQNLEDNNERSGLREGKDMDLLVAPFSGTRGLHIPAIDCVVVLSPPRSMDEYLHLAGRTGRLDFNSKLKAGKGTVVTVATQEELKRMRSWETALGVKFNVSFT